MTPGLPQDLTLYEALRDQRSLIGGLLALVAGGIACLAGRKQAQATLSAARLQIDHEVDALRKSLATEIRQIVARSFTAHKLLTQLSKRRIITASMVESYFLVPTPVVYLGSASKIGLLKDDTMVVMAFYHGYDIACACATQLMRLTPDGIAEENVAGVANAFLDVCKGARQILPRLRTGVSIYNELDKKLVEDINKALSASTTRP